MTSRAQRHRRRPAVCALPANARADRAIRYLLKAAEQLDRIQQTVMAAHCRAFADKLSRGARASISMSQKTMVEAMVEALAEVGYNVKPGDSFLRNIFVGQQRDGEQGMRRALISMDMQPNNADRVLAIFKRILQG